jgi:putative glutathione S-transferase
VGLLVEGQWRDQWYDTEATGGRFVRSESQFRAQLDPQGDFPPEAGRYRLIVSYACPWAHRALIFRAIKGLEALIPVSVVSPLMGAEGWTFEPEDGVLPEPGGARRLHEVYTRAAPRYSGRVTVPVLYDDHTQRIVNNESSEIIRMLDHAYDGLGAVESDHYPEARRGEIDAVNAWIYRAVNNGVYRAGFATTQGAYDEAVTELFAALDALEDRLARQRYLVAGGLTEADWRLFTTLVRFDPVYVGHFKCNLRRLVDYPNLWAYTRALFQVPKVAATVKMGQIKGHYYRSHPNLNPSGVVPIGPQLDFGAPHERHRVPLG